MSTPENHAVSAIWNTNFGSADDKLVMYFLTSKHELGSKTSVTYKKLDEFLNEFTDRWCNHKELVEGTRLSPVKLERCLQNLLKQGYLKTQTKTSTRDKKKVEMGEDGVTHISTIKDAGTASTETQFCVTDKLFREFQNKVSTTGRTMPKAG